MTMTAPLGYYSESLQSMGAVCFDLPSDTADHKAPVLDNRLVDFW